MMYSVPRGEIKYIRQYKSYKSKKKKNQKINTNSNITG